MRSSTGVPTVWPRIFPWIRWALAALIFIWLGARFWSTTVDDTVISIDFARRWATGHGLTWTTGERVEGYSNFLLVALLAGGIRLGADGSLLAQCISVASVLVMLGVLSAWLPRTLSATAGLIALAACGPLDHWGMIGLEGPLYGVLLGVGWALVVDERWGAGVGLLALSSLARPEGAAYVGLALVLRAAGPRRWQTGDTAGAAALAALAAYHIGRVAWFGAFWPTPAVVKLSHVTWSRGGLAQAAGDWVVAAPALAALSLSTRLKQRDLALALIPLLVQTLLLVRASGDWMMYGRFVLPGLMATAITLARRGEARDRSWIRGVAALAMVPLAARWMPVGNSQFVLEKRTLPGLTEARRALGQGLDTPLAEDVVWAALNVPAGDRVLTIDAGMLGAIPKMKLIDRAGLANRAVADAERRGEAEACLRQMLADPATRPEWLRIAGPGDAPLPALRDWEAPLYHLREEIDYGPYRTGWFSTHDRQADSTTARKRLEALREAFPSQPFILWHAALERAELGDLPGALQLVSEGRRRWPRDSHFADAPASLSFPTSPRGLHHVVGRGVGLYWNTQVLSRPMRADELSALRLRLDADAPGADGAIAELRWTSPCGDQTETVAVHQVELRAPPPCDLEGETRVDVRFTNDLVDAGGDRNLYAELVQATTPP